MLTITANVSVSVTRLDTTPDSVSENARWAPDDIGAQPAHQRARPGSGEERDRHALDVIEHRAAQIEDQPLPDGRRTASG